MKKYLLYVLAFLMLLFVTPTINAKTKLPEANREPINVYIFRGETCGYCHSALEFFEESQEKYGDYFKLIGFEVSDEKNQNFWQKVGDYFNDEIGSIPYIVIGDAYHKTGFSEEIGKDIIDIILKQYQNEKYVDVVNKLITDNELSDKIEYQQNSEFTVLTDAKVKSEVKDNSKDAYIIVGIFVVLIGGVAGLVVASRKGN